MSFDVAARSYDRFMGRFSRPLATDFSSFIGVRPGDAVLDVGCGPGALSEALLDSGARVTAVDPSESFVAAVRERLPDIEVRRAGAEALPFADDGFDVAAAQLVVHFMTDPVAGLTEMARVTRSGGTVAACVWDLAGDRGPVSPFWRAARRLDPAVQDESGLAGAGEGHLAELCERAGLREVRAGELTVGQAFTDFEEWWTPYTLGVGPAGAYVVGLDGSGREALREACREALPPGPFTIDAVAWAAAGQVG